MDDFDFSTIWIGPNFKQHRILLLGESWYGDWEDNTDDGYIRLYLRGQLKDRMYTRMANSAKRAPKEFWESIAFTNFAGRVGNDRRDRPTRRHYLDAQPRLRALIKHLSPNGVWILGIGQAEHSAPVIQEKGVKFVVSRHPTAWGVPNAELGEGWSQLLTTTKIRMPNP